MVLTGFERVGTANDVVLFCFGGVFSGILYLNGKHARMASNTC